MLGDNCNESEGIHDEQLWTADPSNHIVDAGRCEPGPHPGSGGMCRRESATSQFLADDRSECTEFSQSLGILTPWPLRPYVPPHDPEEPPRGTIHYGVPMPIPV